MLLSRHTRRRDFAAVFSLACLSPTALFAQAVSPLRKIGVLLAGWDDAGNQANLAAFRQGLEERGLAEGRSSELVIKYASGDPARLPLLASELSGNLDDAGRSSAGTRGAGARRPGLRPPRSPAVPRPRGDSLK